MTDEESDGIGEMVLEQIERQGCGCVRVADGQVFVFTRGMLEKLLAKARANEDGVAMVHVTRGAEA